MVLLCEVDIVSKHSYFASAMTHNVRFASIEDLEDRPWEIEVGKMSRTEMLSRWINHMRCKKRLCNHRRNYRVRAMLTNAVQKAEGELRTKQLLRIRRWKELRRQILKNVHYGSCGAFNMAQEELERGELLASRMRSMWPKDNLCKDLYSLDNFLQQLGAKQDEQVDNTEL